MASQASQQALHPRDSFCPPSFTLSAWHPLPEADILFQLTLPQ
jgi:hypothetical protein